MYIVNAICSIICMQAYRLSPDIAGRHKQSIVQLLEREIYQAVNDDLRIFRVGMGIGPDLWAAESIVRLRDRYFPHIRLHCYLPCETQANNWPESWREQYFDLLAQADEVVCLQTHYTKGCVSRRDTEMIAGSARLIALHDNIADGGIQRAIGYAESRGVETVVIRPLEGPDAPFCPQGDVIRIGGDQSSSQTSSAYSDGFSTGTSAIKRA